MKAFLKLSSSSENLFVEKEITSQNTVDIWIVPLLVKHENLINKFLDNLDSDEKKKATTFKYQSDQAKYIMHHYAVRKILSSYIGCLPSEVALAIQKYGKPLLVNQKHTFHFNSSRSKNFSICAVSAIAPVGVDLEVLKPLDEMHSVLQIVLSQDELRDFSKLSPLDQIPVFYKIWTRKEALLKCSGLGLIHPLTNVSVWSSNVSYKDDGELIRQNFHNKWGGYDFSFTFNKEIYFGSCFSDRVITNILYKTFHFY